ncbi:universal stress protein [Hydrocarboniphaga sp.]|uniref:universal stress protein n=1 Tax=Hydrocarboniphaga sp. TaxID=2033016 RepID=UPI003D11E2E1
MKNLLIPYDGSESSSRALQYALNLPADAAPACINLLNVQAWPMMYGEYLMAGDIQLIQDMQIAEGHKILEPAISELKKHGRDYRVQVLMGNPEQAIASQIDRLNCDHIVMGTRGLGTVKGMFLGSVAMKVVHLVTVPVTLIK